MNKNEEYKVNKFIYIILFLFIITEPGISLLGMYNTDLLSIQRVFKIYDLFAVLLVILVFFAHNYEDYNENNFKKNFWALLVFIIIYIIYTSVYAKTSDLVEAFKSSRPLFYLAMYFVYRLIFRDKALRLFIWRIFIVCIYLSAFIYIFTFVTRSELLLTFTEGIWEYSPFPRIYWGHYSIIYFFLTLGVIQKLIGYGDEYKVSNPVILITAGLTLLSFTRNLWFSFVIGILLVLIINSLYSIKGIKFSKTLRNLIIISALSLIVFSFVLDPDILNVLSFRIDDAFIDIRYGEGTFGSRLNTFSTWFTLLQRLNLEYTGLGFAHGQSSYMYSLLATMPGSQTSGAWGVESAIMGYILYFGYIGSIIWITILIFLIHKISQSIKFAKDNLSLVFGFTVVVTLFSAIFVMGWAGHAFTYTTFPLLIAFYENLLNEGK